MISVVIPAFNEEVLLPRCLESLACQNTSRTFEVIVVDNNSTDTTAAVARSFFNQLNLKIIPEFRLGRGAARRAGFRAAAGDIIFSTDADTALPPEWIETMAARLETTGRVAVAGPARINDCGPLTNFIFNCLQPFSAVGYRLIFGHYWLPGFNFAIRRNAYFAAGEFNPAMDALEDNDLSWRVQKLGKIIFASRSRVTFSGRRFRHRFGRGFLEYITAFISYYFFKQKTIVWPNVR